ncbi:mannose-6-phosphate isomerase [Clostridium sp. MCC353]|uniref:class I mannose-6-phosphate isomerase n=1 Tax=Clostridium sp. MCC353 TaxID=2592646 RepID=UPI001C01E9E9|nr:class I mannose-6-phosphate isomerase [Clostridium sp. MCC353]MBT9776723.1 mannose-6-phosphate isomerase [Clostridium sp. MCC353]
MKKTQSRYNRKPSSKVRGYENTCISGYEAILSKLGETLTDDSVLVVETYPGVYDREVIQELQKIKPAVFIDMESIFKPEEELNEQLKYHLTDDRVFGKMYFGDVYDLLDQKSLESARNALEAEKGIKIIYGFGASLVKTGDILVYLDLSRWEIQLRYRKGMGNYHCSNYDEDLLKKYKRGYFIEWRIADKHKASIFDKIDFFVDTHVEGQPKMVDGGAVREGLKQLVKKPFRTVPYFDPGVWGGQWMKEVCGLDEREKNYAWSFDGVPEENSLLLDFGNGIIEIPAMDLVLYQPVPLLGEKVYARFGAEFPIRFDLLDTMGGQNLSLQVHPNTDYIRKQFGMGYTQDESYYILDAGEDAKVYLGLREGVDKEVVMEELEAAKRGERPFDAKQFINCFPAKKHDHFLIPAGTCHCSGRNTMVLEISATPYIFTFKLWDWDRTGLDGRPRPVHLEHGREVIRWDRTTRWVKENLINQVWEREAGDGYRAEHTGLHELEFIETTRYWIEDEALVHGCGSVRMLNLVEGERAQIISPDAAFEPFEVNYAETLIIPEQVGDYIIRTCEKKKIAVVQAYVRT